jgi:hypothetical protein
VDLESHLDRPHRQRPGVGSTLGLLPEGLSQADGLTVILAITGLGGVVFRKTAKARIGLCRRCRDTDGGLNGSNR